MRRDEAVKLLKEVSDKCPSLTPYAIALMPPDADDVLSLGFQVHISANLDEESILCLKPILEKAGLHLKMLQEKNLLVIYRPRI